MTGPLAPEKSLAIPEPELTQERDAVLLGIPPNQLGEELVTSVGR